MTLMVAQRLVLTQALEDHSEELVELAEQTMTDSQMELFITLAYDGYDDVKRDNYIWIKGTRRYRKDLEKGGRGIPKPPKPVMDLSQLNNYLGVTRETESPAVVRNWLLYQMGRKETQKGWGGSGLGQKVLRDMQRIHQLAEETVSDSPRLRRHAEIMLLQRYAGYLVRWFVARGGQQ